MKKNWCRIFCMALALLTLVSVFAACGSGSSGGKETSKESKKDEAKETEAPYLDQVPESVRYDDKVIRFLPVTSGHGTSAGLPDNESTGDIVEDAIVDRNGVLYERLGVEIEVLEPTGYPNQFSTKVNNMVSAGSDDADVLIGYCSDDIGLAQSGHILNLNNLPYMNFNAEYWGTEYMNAMSYKGINYWATGDISIMYTSFSYAFLVNSTLWDDLYSDDNIYDIVKKHQWTLETLDSYAHDATSDLNGDGSFDKEDRWGFAMQDGHYIMAMATACGVQYSEVDKDGEIVLTLESDFTEDVYERLHDLFFDHEHTTLMYELHEYDQQAMDQFADNRLLFFNMTFNVLEKPEIRNMSSDYMVIPMPMMDEFQEEYYNMLQDGIAIYGVPTTASKDNYGAIGATLEEMASVSYQRVLPAYYDNALKFKYSRDDASGEMIDLIHDTVHADFAFVWGKNISNMTWFMYHNMKKGSASLASAFASNRDKWATELQKLTEALDKNIGNGNE